MTSSLLTCFFCALFPQLQSQDSTYAMALQAEVTRAWGVVATAEADHAAALHATETSAREDTMVPDDTALRVKDVEDWLLWRRGRY
jgi:hypothetical protein